MATKILGDRLARLEGAGILARRADQTDARRVIYGLSSKRADLAPVLTEIVLWSVQHEETDAPPATVRAMRCDRASVIAAIKARWE